MCVSEVGGWRERWGGWNLISEDVDTIPEIYDCGGAREDGYDRSDDAILVYIWFSELAFSCPSSAVMAAVRMHPF